MKSLGVRTMLVVVLFACAAGAGEQAPSADRVRELFELSGVTREAEMIVDQIMQVLRGSNPRVPPDFWEQLRQEMKDSISSGEYLDQLIPIYQKHVSAQDVEALIAFRKSDAGRRFTEAQPKIVAESMEVGRAWGAKLGQKAVEKLKAAPARTP